MSSDHSFEYLATDKAARIAYRKLAPLASVQSQAEVVFLGGFASDMFGSKAEALERFCAQKGYGFLRFDYRGHGQSDGEFTDFGIADWMEDAQFMIERLTNGPVVLIGSSMGGWIATKIARDMPDRVQALITIAAAPDFTEEVFWKEFTEVEKNTIEEGGVVERPSGYEQPYKISSKLIQQGREVLIFNKLLTLPMPVRMFQGLEDQAVSSATALRLADHAKCADLQLRFVKNSDHSFSRESDLRVIFGQVELFVNRA